MKVVAVVIVLERKPAFRQSPINSVLAWRPKSFSCGTPRFPLFGIACDLENLPLRRMAISIPKGRVEQNLAKTRANAWSFAVHKLPVREPDILSCFDTVRFCAFT